MKIALLIPVTMLAACAGDSASAVEQGRQCGLAGPTVTPPSATISQGDTLRLNVSAAGSYCGVNGPFVFRWSSSNGSIATVDSISGLVTAHSTGAASIIATPREVPAYAAAAAITVKN